ncbi:acyltransferase [Bdellovibrio sp. HCB-110]|uniref:acyltransferase n=1 Tax=Bdellovibrio sp. HCB-110 TaxID=3391182 RepID=UPI0039B386DD
MSVFLHETAVVDDGAQIGNGSKVWHFSHVCAKAKIGDNCSLGQNVYVGNDVIIGTGCKIQNNVSIYDNVYLEDYVFCGPSMVFTNVTNPRAEVSRKDEYKKTTVRRGSSIGANATIISGVTLGKYSFVAAGAVVTKDVKDFAMVAGVPAKQIGWMSAFGEKIPLPLEGIGEWKCSQSRKVYKLNVDILVENP